jgi:hypothetical protein
VRHWPSPRVFVPWEELTHCEIVHGDRDADCDYFRMTDRENRIPHSATDSWLRLLSCEDRGRLFSFLRREFRGGVREVQSGETGAPILTRNRSQLWDREFDG